MTATSAQPRRTAAEHLRRLSLLAALAIAGQVILNASAWLLPIVSEFSLIGDNMSELVLGRLGFVQTIAFLIAGAGTLGLAYVIQQLTMPSWKSRIGSLLIALYGMGAIIVAIFPTDRVDSASDVWSQSTTGMIHVIVALISFLCVVAGMFLLTWAFFGQARWRAITPWWTMIFPAAALPLFLGQGEGPLVGLSQRLLVAAVSVWLILVALRARSIVESDEMDTPSQEPIPTGVQPSRR